MQTTTTLTARDYEDALAVQSAPNLRGIVRSFVEVLDKIAADSPASADIAGHPITRLFAEQIRFLATADYSDAYGVCVDQVRAAGGDV